MILNQWKSVWEWLRQFCNVLQSASSWPRERLRVERIWDWSRSARFLIAWKSARMFLSWFSYYVYCILVIYIQTGPSKKECLLHFCNLHSNWSFKEGILQYFAREREYISSLVRQYWIQWTCLDSIIVLLTMMVDYWLFSITILIFHQHGDQRLTGILSWSKWRQVAVLLVQDQRFDYFLFARSSKICSW